MKLQLPIDQYGQLRCPACFGPAEHRGSYIHCTAWCRADHIVPSEETA